LSEQREPFGRVVRAPKTAELIAEQIRGQIVRSEIAPGTTLPNEAELMSQFGVSRPTLREAFRILETESLIAVRRGVAGGAQVLAPDIAVGARYVGLLLQLDGATIADVYEARMVLEPVCARMMANRADASDVAGLGECIASLQALIAAGSGGIPDQRSWSRTTYAFHELVLKGSGNKTLALQGGLLQEVVATHYAATVAGRFPEPTRPDRFRRVVLSFRKLVKLVEQGDGAAAERHWLKHMETASVTLLGEDLRNKRVVDLFN
jgi:GntR family transcriptional repressor for pyruvate dehydrogenase complex